MHPRLLISIANFVAIVLAFVVLFEFPQYSNEAFYFLIAWMIAGFVLLYTIRPRSAPLPSDGTGFASPFPSTAPSGPAASGGPEPSGGIGFCIYCAAPIVPGAQACPACGHALPRW
jgi:hypothetical protein